MKKIATNVYIRFENVRFTTIFISVYNFLQYHTIFAMDFYYGTA